MTTTMQDMAKLKGHSKEWFDAAFEDVDTPDYIKTVAPLAIIALA